MAFTDSAHLHSCCSLFWNYTAGGEKLKEAENESECSTEGRKCSDAFSMDTIVTTHMTALCHSVFIMLIIGTSG